MIRSRADDWACRSLRDCLGSSTKEALRPLRADQAGPKATRRSRRCAAHGVARPRRGRALPRDVRRHLPAGRLVAASVLPLRRSAAPPPLRSAPLCNLNHTQACARATSSRTRPPCTRLPPLWRRCPPFDRSGLRHRAPPECSARATPGARSRFRPCRSPFVNSFVCLFVCLFNGQIIKQLEWVLLNEEAAVTRTFKPYPYNS